MYPLGGAFVKKLFVVMFVVAVMALTSVAATVAPRTVSADGNANPLLSTHSATQSAALSTTSGSRPAPINAMTIKSVTPWNETNTLFRISPNADSRSPRHSATALGDPIDFTAALTSAGDYLRHMQADVTEDNAGNGSPDVPADPNDGGWDWSVVSPPAPFFHTTSPSPKNTYGVTALGLYYAYLRNSSANLLTAMTDAANVMIADATIRSASDVIFLQLYDDLPAVAGTTYRDAAKAKFDGRITAYGSATALAQAIRDARGGSYPNGIIGWDLGAWAKAAAFLSARYGNSPHDYAQDAKDIAEVLWQDSYNSNPGYFDVVADAGWDPSWSNVNYWWYTLGISGLVDAFVASGIHTTELPGLVARIKASQLSSGAVSGSYGAHATDEDWQSTAYAAMSLAYYDQSTYQLEISRMGYWTAVTQDPSGGWKYSNDLHYPELGGENASALYLALPPTVVVVDDDFTDQSDVDTYNTAHSTSYVFGYDAFKTIQNGINGVAAGGQVLVESGTYVENIVVNKGVTLTGAGQATCTVIPAMSGPNTGSGSSLPPGHSTIMLIQANNVTISGFTLDGDNPSLTSSYNVGGANLDARNGIITNHPMGVFTNLTVHDVTIKNIYLRGIYASSGGSFNFHHNVVTNVQAEYASIGMFNVGGSGVFANNTVSYCNDAISSNWSTGTQYLDNTITNSGSGVHSDNNGGFGGTADLLKGNSVSNSLANGYGVWVFYPYLNTMVEDNIVSNVDVGLLEWGTGSATGTATFTGNIVNGLNRANSVGVYVTTGTVPTWGYASDARASFGGNTIKNTAYGYYSDELDGFNTTVALTGNKLVGNGEGLENAGAALNVQNNAFGNTVNALDNTAANYYNANCWSDYSGSGPYAIGGGGGNQDLAPGSDCGLNMSPENILYLCGGNFTFTVSVGDIVQNLDAADLRFEYPAELGVVSIAAASGNFFLTYSQTAHGAGQKDTLKVNLGVLTGSLNGPADLFTVTMNGSSVCSPSQIAMIYRDLRDNLNSAITVPLALPSTFKSDCIDPTIVVNSPAPGGFYITSPALNLSAADNCGLLDVYYQIDGCTPAWSAIVTGLSGTTYSNAAWTIPGFGALTDGNHCLRFKVIDQNTRGNADSCATTWCFTKDTQAPAPPTNLVAKPGHNNVKLTWTNSVSSDVVGVRIQRVPWTDYPNFGSQPTPTSAPSYPANQGLGTNVFDSAATANAAVAHKDVSGLTNATRDIYYYAAFAYDAAGNYSVSAVSAQGRSTSYWLGDLTDNTFSPTAYDGNVYVQDLALFSVAYGTKQGDPAFSAYADFGPTFGGSPKGIPLPDDSVQFEDLVIFAINFDAVSPIAKTVPIFADQTVNGNLTLALNPTVANGVTTYHLNLLNNAGDLKAFRAVIDLGENALLQTAQISSALTNSADPVFAKVLTQGHRVTIDAAILGTGTTIGGSGEVAALTVSNADKAQIVEADLRNNENSALAVTVSSPAAAIIPGQYALGQNYPNPFNPTTQISYDLPVAGYARLEIFNLLGQRVAVVVDAFQQAGSHTIEWNSQDDAGHTVSSGIYLYRLTVNDYSSTRKMLLMK
jgi:hypothetical protein